MEDQNPVVLLSGNTWHIVEHSRRSAAGLCGRPLAERRAHARLRQVGVEHICQECVTLWQKNMER